MDSAPTQDARKPEGPARGGRASGMRMGILTRVTLATLLFAVSTWWALTRFNRPDPYKAPAVFTWAWWLHPLEVNAPARLPIVTGTLTSLAVDRSEGVVYAAGQGGMLLRYKRSSQVWERVPIPDSLSERRFRPVASDNALFSTGSPVPGK